MPRCRTPFRGASASFRGALVAMLLSTAACGPGKHEPTPATPAGEALTISLKNNPCRLRVELFDRDPATGVASNARVTFIDLLGESGWSAEFPDFKAAYLSEDAAMSLVEKRVREPDGKARTLYLVLFNARGQMIRVVTLPEAANTPPTLSPTGRYLAVPGEGGGIYHANTLSGEVVRHPALEGDPAGWTFEVDDQGKLMATSPGKSRKTWRFDAR